MNEPNARFFVIAIPIVLGCIWILASYARLILCSWCRSPWAVYPRAAGDLCRSCSEVFDKNRVRAGRRRSLLRRIWRSAA